MVIARKIWRPSWWVLSKSLIFTAPVWCAYLLFSYQEDEFLRILSEPWVQPDYALTETSCASWEQVRYDNCE